MAQSLLVQSKKSDVRVSEQFAEIAAIKGGAEEHIVKANAQAAQLQTQAKIRSTEKWQRATEGLANLFVNKAAEGRIEAGRQKGQMLIKEAIKTNTFLAPYKTKENVLGFSKHKKHDEEANKLINAHNQSLLANAINSPFDKAEVEALVPENRQAVVNNLQGIYEGIIEELEELGNPELVNQARFLMADKMYALEKDIMKRQFAEGTDKMTGEWYRAVAEMPHARNLEELKQQNAKLALHAEQIRNARGSDPSLTLSGIKLLRERNETTYDFLSKENTSIAVNNIVPLLDEYIDPDNGFILTPENVDVVQEQIDEAITKNAETAMEIGIQPGIDMPKEVRNNVLTAAAMLHNRNSFDLEERGIIAGGRIDPQLLKDVAAEEVARGELVNSELSAFISDPTERSEWLSKANDQLHKDVKDKKEALSTFAEKENQAESDRLTAPVKNSLYRADNRFEGTDFTTLGDEQLDFAIIYDFSADLYGRADGMQPTKGEWHQILSDKIAAHGFDPDGREAKRYTILGWKRYNSNIAPFSAIAEANGYKRNTPTVALAKRDGKGNAIIGENGVIETSPLAINDEGLNNLAKSQDNIEDASIKIISNPYNLQEARSVVVKRNDEIELNPKTRYGRFGYSIIAGVPYSTEDFEGVDISKDSTFADSINAETGFSLLEANSYLFLRSVGARSEVKEEAAETGAYVDLGTVEKFDVASAYEDGVFLPLANGFKPATEEDFQNKFGDDFSSVGDLLAADPRRFLSSGNLDDETEAYIRENLDSYFGVGISIRAVGHENGFSKITYILYDEENEIALPGEYTIDIKKGLQ